MKKQLLFLAVLLSPVMVMAQNTAEASSPATEKSTNTPASFFNDKRAWNYFISTNLRYPKDAYINNIQGQVLVEFTIEADGSLTNANVLSSPSDDMSKEGLRVVMLSPKWKPATKDGKPVSAKFTYPINFKLTPSKPNN